VRVRALILAAAAAAIVAAAALAALVTPAQTQRVDLSFSPPTIFTTLPFAVGDTYTVGSTYVPLEAERPVRITGVEVIHSRGVAVLGIGAFDPDVEGTGLGLVPGWPPGEPAIAIRDPVAGRIAWYGAVAVLVGVRTTEPKSGLRGIEIRWVDANGAPGSRIFDFAVITCAPGVCETTAGEPESRLRELGLVK
jgi:hypothetical protein